MFVSDALPRLHIEVQQDVYDFIPLNFLEHMNTSHIHHQYKHLHKTHINVEQNNKHR